MGVSCTNQTATYSIQLPDVMAAESTLLLVTNIQNMTETLDVGIVTFVLLRRWYLFKIKL